MLCYNVRMVCVSQAKIVFGMTREAISRDRYPHGTPIHVVLYTVQYYNGVSSEYIYGRATVQWRASQVTRNRRIAMLHCILPTVFALLSSRLASSACIDLVNENPSRTCFSRGSTVGSMSAASFLVLKQNFVLVGCSVVVHLAPS